MKSKKEEVDLLGVFKILKKNILSIVLFTLLIGAMFFGISKFIIKPNYESSTTMMIGGPISNQEDKQNIQYYEIQANRALVSTYSEVVKSKGVADKVIKNLNLDLSYGEFSNKVSIEPVNDTQIISIKVIDNIPERATDIANETSMIFKDSISKIMKVDNVQILDKATIPTKPSSPNILKNTLIGYILGFIIGIIFSLFKELSDTTFKSTDDIQEAFDIPVLGMVPDKSKGE